MLRFFRNILKGWRARRITADAAGGVRDDAVAETAIHIHEDDCGMRNLYPVEASLELVGWVEEKRVLSLRAFPKPIVNPRGVDGFRDNA